MWHVAPIGYRRPGLGAGATGGARCALTARQRPPCTSSHRCYHSHGASHGAERAIDATTLKKCTWRFYRVESSHCSSELGGTCPHDPRSPRRAPQPCARYAPWCSFLPPPSPRPSPRPRCPPPPPPPARRSTCRPCVTVLRRPSLPRAVFGNGGLPRRWSCSMPTPKAAFKSSTSNRCAEPPRRAGAPSFFFF